MLKPMLVALLALVVSACETIPGGPSNETSTVTGLPKTLGEISASYGYVPLDPLAVDTEKSSDSCREQGAVRRPLLQALPDLTVRFAVASFNANGGLSFGPAQFTAKGSNYRAVLDYINVDSVSVTFAVRKLVVFGQGHRGWSPVTTPITENDRVITYQAQVLETESQPNGGTPLAVAVERRASGKDESYDFVTVPIYIGIGLRLSADVLALKSDISLTGLSVIGVEAAAENLSGTLTVQTLGVTGPRIATSLPLPSKLDTTTIENSLLAIGGSRTMLYSESDDGSVVKTPRVVGLYSPIGTDPGLINAFYAALSDKRPIWFRPCGAKPDSTDS